MHISARVPVDVIYIPMPNQCYGSREGEAINSLILHSVGLNITEVFRVFKKQGVSSHYLIPEVTANELLLSLSEIYAILDLEYCPPNLQYPDKIPILQLVADEHKAYHAGVSKFGNLNTSAVNSRSLNAASLSIEFHNSQYAIDNNFYHFAPFVEEQKETGKYLIKYLLDTYAIDAQNVLAHSSISVGRKTDPGPLFDWEYFHEAGLVYLPCGGVHTSYKIADPVSFVQQQLYAIGFVDCPQHGVLDNLTQQHIDAYIMQFASHLWIGNNNPISDSLLDYLHNHVLPATICPI